MSPEDFPSKKDGGDFVYRLILVGVVTGIAAALFYPAAVFLPRPQWLARLFAMALGPLLAVSFLGLERFIRLHRPSVCAYVAMVFGILAGLAVNLMIIVQESSRHYIRGYIAEAPDQDTKDMLEWVFRSVFSVQLGIDVSWDIFICLATVLVAIPMLWHPRFHPVLAVAGIAVGGLTLIFNLYTFPVPPAEADLVDLGPLVGLWFLVVTVQVARSLSWVRARTATSEAGA